MIPEARKKVLLDLFGSPLTLFPLAAGAACLVLSWAIGGNSMLNFAGICGGLGGLATFATRLTGYKALLTKQRQYEHEEKIKHKKQELDLLDSKLTKDMDPRTQNCLREIRHLYQSLEEDIKGDVSKSGYQILETIEDLFHACVEQLEHSYELHETAKHLSGGNKKKVKKERERVVEEVVEATAHLGEFVQEFRVLKSKRNKKDLSSLRKKLDSHLDVAQRVSTQMNEYDVNLEMEFDEFMEEDQPQSKERE
jgi:hypothetical protein